MATAAQNSIYTNSPYQPDFIQGIAARPVHVVSNSAGVTQAAGIRDTLERDQRAVQSQAQAIMDLETEHRNNAGEEKEGDIAEQQTRAQNQLTWELARALVGEELVLYPAYEKYLRDGKGMAEGDRKMHDDVSICFLYIV